MNKLRLKLMFVISAVFLFVIIVACLPVAERNTELEPVKASVTPSVTLTIVPTNTPKPTASHTSTPKPTPTSTTTPVPTSTMTATPLPTPEVLHSYSSPSGEWTATFAEGNFFNEPDSFLFQVVNAGGEVEWVVEHIIPKPGQRGLWSISFPTVLDWSNDEQTMYYTYNGVGDGCGPFREDFGLFRFDLQKGQSEELVAPREGYWMAVAPNDEKAAYLKYGENDELILFDFATQEKVVVKLGYDPEIEYILFSNLTWSPDSNALLALGEENVCATGMFLDTRYFIIRIDMPSLLQKTIIDDPALREILDWQELNKVLLSVSIGNAKSENVWLDPGTGELTPVNE
ncbi:MAG: hypothetical protein IPG51_17370 [Chloroflexi bacterium]|nr:hypothetical protein [Chloroflexota bacterium]